MSISPAIQARVRGWPALVMPASPTRFSLLVAALLATGLALLNAAAIVQAVNIYHAFAIGAPLDKARALRHGAGIFALEGHLRIAVEPGVQRLLSRDLRTPLGVLPAAAIRRLVVWVYLNALPAWLFAALAWVYLYKPRQFPVLRDLTVVSILLVVACYRLFPAAPPRFVLRGAPYHLADWTYGGTSIDARVVHMVGFNPYAAFPSVHVLWAIIPALCLAVGSRRVWVWLAALCYPLAMLAIVVASGNHYILDAAGSVAVLAVSLPLVAGVRRVRRWTWAMRGRGFGCHDIPPALGLCLICAGALAVVGISGGVRTHIAAAIVVLIVYASGRSPYLWRGCERTGNGETDIRATEYLAGLLFVAGAAGAAHHAGPLSLPSPEARVCALLWLGASMAALHRHLTARGPLRRRGYDLGDALRQMRGAR